MSDEKVLLFTALVTVLGLLFAVLGYRLGGGTINNPPVSYKTAAKCTMETYGKE